MVIILSVLGICGILAIVIGGLRIASGAIERKRW